MILVGERLYLNRMWCNECSIAAFLPGLINRWR
jgi:exodeoxyribonuclease V alpha subunit